MQLSFLFFGNTPDEKWLLAKQMGVEYAIAKLAPELTGDLAPWDISSLRRSKMKYDDAGFKLIGFEGDQFDMMRIKLGLPGRNEDIELYKTMLRNMAELDIELICYNFMPTGWFRTKKDVVERGGALVSAFDIIDASSLPLTPYGRVSKERMWDNYQYFIEKVMPVAEDAGIKMALHPDDPPVPELQGIARIFINADAIRKALSLIQSPSHGLTFCQGTYTTMQENVPDLISEFGNSGKIFFVHFRDVIGGPTHFRETFHDNGPTDMANMLRLYNKIGFEGPIRSDHVPTMAGETNNQHGYEMKGSLFGIGYMIGLMEALEIPRN